MFLYSTMSITTYTQWNKQTQNWTYSQKIILELKFDIKYHGVVFCSSRLCLNRKIFNFMIAMQALILDLF